MSYEYARERANVFTKSGQRMFLSIRDRTHRLIKTAGVARCQEMISGECGDSWTMLACVDRLVELGEITEIPSTMKLPGQYRIFMNFKE